MGRGKEEERMDVSKQASQENPIETEALMQRVDIPLTAEKWGQTRLGAQWPSLSSCAGAEL